MWSHVSKYGIGVEVEEREAFNWFPSNW